MSPRASALPSSAAVAVIGAGAMGAGIAQVAAIAGHRVLLYDTRTGAAETAAKSIRESLSKLEAKGRLSAEASAAAAHALVPIGDLAEVSEAALVIEVIVENLDVKRELFKALEAVVKADALFATNTSSISITAIAAALKRPDRLVGMHFFNPAPLMPLVEVISGAATAPAAAETIFETARAWGKTPVHARSTPGFIVNRVARPFYAEGLRLLQEGVADAATTDAILRECGGFKMGPFELMDLIGHDVNYAVTRSVFDAFYGDTRFQPSLIQLELVNAGFLGRKSGRGFFDYQGAEKPGPSTEPRREIPGSISVNETLAWGSVLANRLKAAGVKITDSRSAVDAAPFATVDGIEIHLTDGRTATERAHERQVPDMVLVDLLLDPERATRIALSCALQCSARARDAAIGLFQSAGFSVCVLKDSPGLAVMRTVAMLVNEACDAVHQGVCDLAAVDVAMRGGVGYPIGPIEWANAIGAPAVLAVLDNLSHHYGETRYRASPLLRQHVWAGKDLR